MKRFIKVPSPSMVVALVALGVALSGSAYAVSGVSSKAELTRSSGSGVGLAYATVDGNPNYAGDLYSTARRPVLKNSQGIVGVHRGYDTMTGEASRVGIYCLRVSSRVRGKLFDSRGIPKRPIIVSAVDDGHGPYRGIAKAAIYSEKMVCDKFEIPVWTFFPGESRLAYEEATAIDFVVFIP